MPHILFAASGSDSVWHPTACQGGLIPYWYLALTGFPFVRLSTPAKTMASKQSNDLPEPIQLWKVLSGIFYLTNARRPPA